MKKRKNCKSIPERHIKEIEVLSPEVGIPTFDALSTAIVITDLDGVTLYTNPIGQQLLATEDYALLAKRVPAFYLQVRQTRGNTSQSVLFLVNYVDLRSAEGQVTGHCAVITRGPEPAQLQQYIANRFNQLLTSVEEFKKELGNNGPGDDDQVNDGPFASQALSPRQHEVLDAIHADGQIRDIADALDMSQHAVRNDLRAIMRKCGLQSLEGLLAIDVGDD